MRLPRSTVSAWHVGTRGDSCERARWSSGGRPVAHPARRPGEPGARRLRCRRGVGRAARGSSAERGGRVSRTSRAASAASSPTSPDRTASTPCAGWPTTPTSSSRRSVRGSPSGWASATSSSRRATRVWCTRRSPASAVRGRSRRCPATKAWSWPSSAASSCSTGCTTRPIHRSSPCRGARSPRRHWRCRASWPPCTNGSAAGSASASRRTWCRASLRSTPGTGSCASSTSGSRTPTPARTSSTTTGSLPAR